MKIAYFTYPTAFNFFGGGELQLLKTKEYIEKMDRNYHVKLFDIFQDRLEHYDILHNFSISPDCLSLCKMAKMKGVKVALSPIYWTPSNLEKQKVLEKRLIQIKSLYENLTRYRLFTFQRLTPYKEFLELSNIILPNSEMEASLISNTFRIRGDKFHVVPNGVDKGFADAKPDLFVQKYGLKDFILFVGRIEARKNVVSLLSACKGLNVPVVIIGHDSVWEHDYFGLFRKMVDSDPNFRYLGFLSPNSEDLASAYAAAKVFVLPSWFETPGLSALEAGLANCNVVITRGGSTTEYFRDLAWYVDPASIKDIREKISAALEKPKTTILRRHILENYTWETVAEKTVEAYDSIV
jgi:glycosyltransferase involved in cell wall biosynthesis